MYNIIRCTQRLTTQPKSFFLFCPLLSCHNSQPEQYRDAYDTTRDMMMDFREKRRAAEFVFVCIRRLLAFSFLKILLEWVRLCFVYSLRYRDRPQSLYSSSFVVRSSQSYMHKYLTDIEHDNAYVTRYYRKIDARRKKTGKHTLLPLKKTEKSKTVDLRNYKLVNRECDHLVGT